jgi:hypothetical protein
VALFDFFKTIDRLNSMHTLDTFRTEIQIEAGQPIPRRYNTQRGTGAEALEVRRRLGTFDALHSPIGQLIRDTFPGVTRTELISVAQMTVVVVNQRYPNSRVFLGDLDRVTRRSMDLIIKWYHDNWGILQHILCDIGLADDRFRPITRLVFER